ncbi:MAG: hypothetical protein LBT59_04155 [Clostridiales bacterium]|jgi:hypothetical protein|nr:hypothetical protein [Clostridiales bacterium]
MIWVDVLIRAGFGNQEESEAIAGWGNVDVEVWGALEKQSAGIVNLQADSSDDLTQLNPT